MQEQIPEAVPEPWEPDGVGGHGEDEKAGEVVRCGGVGLAGVVPDLEQEAAEHQVEQPEDLAGGGAAAHGRADALRRDERNQNDAVRFGKRLSGGSKAVIGDDHCGVAMVEGLPGGDLLHGTDADRLGIVFALDSVFFKALPCDDVNAVITAGLRHFYGIKTVFSQIRRDGVFVVISVHRYLSENWNKKTRQTKVRLAL